MRPSSVAVQPCLLCVVSHHLVCLHEAALYAKLFYYLLSTQSGLSTACSLVPLALPEAAYTKPYPPLLFIEPNLSGTSPSIVCAAWLVYCMYINMYAVGLTQVLD